MAATINIIGETGYPMAVFPCFLAYSPVIYSFFLMITDGLFAQLSSSFILLFSGNWMSISQNVMHMGTRLLRSIKDVIILYLNISEEKSKPSSTNQNYFLQQATETVLDYQFLILLISPFSNSPLSLGEPSCTATPQYVLCSFIFTSVV